MHTNDCQQNKYKFHIGNVFVNFITGQREPEERLRECQQRCWTQKRAEQVAPCVERCEQEYKREKEQQQHGRGETGEENQGTIQLSFFRFVFLFLFRKKYFLLLLANLMKKKIET